MTGMMAWCGRCESHKPVTEFWRNNKSKNGLQYACKSCCAIHNSDWARANPDRWKTIVVRSKLKRAKADPVLLWARHTASNAKGRARKIGVPYSLTFRDLVPIAPEFCPVLGLRLVYAERGRARHDASPSVDRLDLAQGYVPGNVIVVSWRANFIRSNATPAELRAIADFYS
jgi:hypothetical protein